MRRFVSLLLIAGLAGPLAAQSRPSPASSPGVDRLEALLRELGSLDPALWNARLAALEARAKEKEALASNAAAAAKELRAEIARLESLRALLTTRAPTPAKGPESRPASAARIEVVTWNGHVARILDEHCSGCHDPSDKKGGLDVSTFGAVRQGGGSGKTIVPGEPDQSRLWRLVAHEERPYMPEDADPLSADLVRTIRTWIEQGAEEDEGSARAFLARKASAPRAPTPETAVPGALGPLPSGLPAVPLTTLSRAVPLLSLARSPRASVLAMPGVRQVVLLDPGLRPLGVLPVAFSQVGALAFSSDGTLLAVAAGEAGKSGRVLVFEVRSGALRATLGSERDTPLAVAVHAERGLVALGGSGKAVEVLRLDGKGGGFVGKHEDFVLGLDFSSDGGLLAASDRAGKVQLWETAGGRIAHTLGGHRGAVHGVAFQPGARMLASVGADGTLRGWDANEGKELWRQAAHQGEALALAFGPSDRLASAGTDGVVKVWTRAGRSVAASPAVGEWLYTIAFGGDGDTVLAGDWLGRAQRFEVKTRKVQTLVTPLRELR